MNETKEQAVFLSQEDLWCCRTRKVNAGSGRTIEYHIRTGLKNREEAEKILKETELVFQKELKNLKVSSNCLFTFTEYLECWFNKHSSNVSGTTKVKYHWIIYHLIFPNVKSDPLLQDINAEYLESVIGACKEYCTSAEYAVYKLLCMVASSILQQGVLSYNIAFGLSARKEPRSNVCIYSKEQMKFFLRAVNNDPYSHRLEYYLALFCGLRPGEILGLTYDNFHPDTGILDIYKQYTKDGSLPAEHSAFKFSYKNLEESRSRSLKIPEFIQDELTQRQTENNNYYMNHPEKEDVYAFCISSRGTIKTLETLNTRLKHITKECGLPLISMYDLRNMFVWILIESNCDSKIIQNLTGGFEISRILEV